MKKNIWLISDTHGRGINLLAVELGDILIHLGDYAYGRVNTNEDIAIPMILIKGNHDDILGAENPFDFVCDGILLDGIWFSHEPVAHLPKGAHLNIHGHLHEDRYEDYGYVKKDFHRRLEPNKLYRLEDII